MISRFHPDSLNEVEDVSIQRAQDINEAYRILSQSNSHEIKNIHRKEAHGADKHKPGKKDRSRSDCVHEQVAKRTWNVRFIVFPCNM